MITYYSVSLLLFKITLPSLVLQGTPDWINSINYSCSLEPMTERINPSGEYDLTQRSTTHLVNSRWIHCLFGPKAPKF